MARAKKTENAEKELTPREIAANACGALSGASDYLGRAQYDLQDVEARCQKLAKWLKSVPGVHPHLKALDALAGYCAQTRAILATHRIAVIALGSKVDQYRP